MRRKATSKPPVASVELAKPVVAEIVCNPLTGVPVRAKSNEYRPEYCEMIIRMFSEMLDASAIKLATSEIEETREIAEREPAQGKVTGKVGRRQDSVAGRGEMQITTKRTVHRKEAKIVAPELPSMAKFGRLIGVSTRHLKRWMDLYPTFSEAVQMCMDMGEDALSNRALTGQYDAEFSKFVGKNWYGMKDRQEITGADGAPLNPPPQLRLISTEELESAMAKLQDLRRSLLDAGPTKQITGGTE